MTKMLIHSQLQPRFNHQLNSPLGAELNYQFCFLNRPFVSEDNAKDVYYKLLIWPKAGQIINDFSFLIKINHQGLLKPLEFLEFPKTKDNHFDPWADAHLTVKIPQALYQSQMEFVFSFKAFEAENYGQLFLNLNLFNAYQIDNQLIFYDLKAHVSTNLLAWNLVANHPEITFNTTYPTLLSLSTNLIDLTYEITAYESVKQLRFLAFIDAQPKMKNFALEGLANKKKAYNFQPQIQWWQQEELDQKKYHLQLKNRLALVGEQIQEVSAADFGFKANPYLANDQVLTLSFSFLTQEFQVPLLIRQATLYYQSAWKGGYFEV